MLELINLSCGYGSANVLEGVSFTLARGELLCLLGPNGVGKTTLFKTILGLLPVRAGQIRLHGQDIRHWPRRQLAHWMGYVPQAHVPPFPFTVLDVVTMGRVAHLGFRVAPRAEDRAIARDALDALGIASLSEAVYTDISGGQRQLTLIARALAQQPRVLVMDEPTSSLDYGNQLKVLGHIRRIVSEQDVSVILTTHHPDHALLHASRVLALDRDKRCLIGAPAEVIQPAYLQRAYDVAAEVHDIDRRDGGRVRVCVPAGRGD